MFRCLILWAAVAVLFVPQAALGQTPPKDPIANVLAGLAARSIGPANMGGRIVDLAVVESNPDTFYVAAAGGGIWKTTNGGSTFAPLFEDQPTLCIGAVAVCQGKPDVVYVGTGEGNPRNSVSPGRGVFKSNDGGKTWTACGLTDTHHIGRVVVHPTNPDIAYVAALGHFWGPNPARGLYKTTDGGKTWTLAKFIDENTGFVDVCMDPAEPDTLYACAWQVRRDPFSGGNPRTMTGPNGGIFKTTDAGKTWTKLGGGLPDRPYGRCGVSVYRKDPRIVYAVVQTDRTTVTVSGQLAPELSKGGKPLDTPRDAALGGVFRSEDAGKTWKKLSELVPRPFYYGQIRVDPTSDERIYVLGVGFYSSSDGGKTFAAGPAGVHPDHHALWVNPKDPSHLILGNDGGLYVSRNRGRTFEANRGLVISQFYGVAVDMQTPYRVYGGLQDNGSWGGPVATAYPDGVTQADWRRIRGGDGFQCAVDPNDPNTVYAESQYGALARIDPRVPYGQKGSSISIRPRAAKDGPVNRYNWNSPILLSPHNPQILYYAGQYVFRSTNRGDSWERISPDLTRGPKEGPVTNSGHTVTTLAESPLKAGVIWAGTDDGNLWLARDGGKDWVNLTAAIPGLPTDRWISGIECSPFDEGTAYVAVDRHRNDDFQPYLFKTTDFGKTWVSISGGLPAGATVNVVRQSSRSKQLFFVGTELGLYVSVDGAKTWHHLTRTGMPASVRVDDVVIHPRDRELVIGTHGRGLWIMDIAPLEQLTTEVLKAEAHLFDLKPVTLLKPRQRTEPAPRGFAAPNPPAGLAVSLYTGGRSGVRVGLSVTPPGPKADRVTVVPDGAQTAGLHQVTIGFKELGGPVPGEYTVTLLVDDKPVATKKVTVKAAE